MAQAIHYCCQGQSYKIKFKDPKAKLPIRCRDGSIELRGWGRRQNEAGNLPLGGWAKLQDIQQRQWDSYFPKPVKLDVIGFMESDFEDQQHWFHLVKGQYIQGLFAHYDQESRIYIVTIDPVRHDNIFQRWPRIMNECR